MRAIAILCCLSALCPDSALRATEQRPNVIVFLADDLGYAESAWRSEFDFPTPAIESIRRNGVCLTSGYVTASYCSPSRAALMTGRYQSRFGYEKNPVGAANEDPDVGLPVSEKTLAQYFKDAGYKTALVGKWHLGGTARFHPQRRGFDEFFGFLHEGHYYVPPPFEGVSTMLRVKRLPDGSEGRVTIGSTTFSTHMGNAEPAYDANNPILRSSQPVEEAAYFTDAITREACGFIERSRDQPFFLYVAYNAVHSPLQGAESYMRKFRHIEDIQRRIFAAMLANMDDSMAEVLKVLQKNGLNDNTLIVFLSDNGGPTRELTSSNAPLRGEKGDLYEGGIRVPFLMQWNGRLPAGSQFDEPVCATDILPTTLAAAGIVAPAGRSDGVNLLPFLTDEESNPPHDELFWRQNQKAALRKGDWKLVNNSRKRNEPQWELFNLSNDTSETHDLARREPERLQMLIERWEEIAAEMPPQ
ncbi:sulfatase-like hydrolase/transferase [Rubinisphaera margarita]|uniref:sulfatase-like hydrolase/transferase n=1 Tax=Rubinisphaera margarita TaxID=2909586 RepID=UPI001EE7B913|nr:sulfatase-like hydrolase/transferase [Rubinisphaera margarita]MCG6156096.1 sulfatase-like hydrolase/transferase [Rubinisphaera margarita]